MSGRQYLKAFAQRKGGPSPEEMEARFTESENRRLQVFNESTLQQQQHYSDVEKSHWEGDKLRTEQFELAVAKMDETFVANEEHRDKAFQDVEVEQDKVFQDNEMSQEKRFKEREVNREECFRQYQDARQKRSEWYAHLRELHVQEERQIREESCQKLERELLDQYDLLVRFQQDSFAAAERRRDEVVKEMLTTRDSHGVHNGIYEGTTRTASENVLSPSEHTIPAGSRSSSPSKRSISPSYPEPGPVTTVTQRSWHDTRHRSRSRSLDEIVVVAPRSPLERSRSPRRSHSPQSDRISKSPVIVQHIQEGLSTTHHRDVYESRFEESQERLQKEFLTDEEHRNLYFTQVEGKRDRAEEMRTEVFERYERNRKLKSQIATTRRDKRFLRKELSRDSREEWRRQQFEEAEDLRSQLLKRSWLWDQKHFSAMNEIETAKWKGIQDRVEQVDERQRGSFEQAKERQSAAFSQSQAHREKQLGLISLPERRRPSSAPVHENWQSQSSRRPPSPIIRMVPGHTVLGQPPWMSRSRSRSPTRMYHAPTSFGRPVVVMPPDVGESLLVPLKEERGPREQQFHIAQGRRDLAFEQFQAERAKAFQNGMRRRQQVFNHNEKRRQQEFEEKQRARKQTSSEKEEERAIKFTEAQNDREARFEDGEDKRESEFRKAEDLRGHTFRNAEADREETFFSHQEELQNECLESENQRRSDFHSWERRRIQSLLQRDREQRDTYEADEKERERSFVEAISQYEKLKRKA